LDTLFGRPRKGANNSPRPHSDLGLPGGGNGFHGGAGPGGVANAGGDKAGGYGGATSNHNEGGHSNRSAEIAALSQKELEVRFEALLNDMNLSEAKKTPLLNMPDDYKRKMLVMHLKGASDEYRPHSKFDKAHDYINYLAQPELSLNKTHACVESLRIALTNNPLSWVQDFGTKGLQQLLETLNECYRK
ncbi:protein diaphanous-like, partial [Ctenocephalides felis]